MDKMGQYCKAYPVDAMRQFPGWHENAHAFKTEDASNSDGPDNDRIVYLQENYVVTDGIFIDQNVVFDEVTDAWIEFCQKTLNFELPDAAVTTGKQADTLTANV